MKTIVYLIDIVRTLGDAVVKVEGEIEGKYIDNLSDPTLTTPTTLDWVKPTNKQKQTIAEDTIAQTILVDPEVAYTATMKEKNKTLIYVNNPRNAISIIGNCYFVKKATPGIHPTAIIDKEAIIGKDVMIDAYTVIGKAVIGDGTTIGSHVRIYDDVKVGPNCVIANHVSLGGCGFGFEKNKDGHWMKFPQIGGLEIGNEVELGTFVTVDRGALSNTRIGNYSKIDSYCKIAHNSIIGENVVIAGCTSIGGSNTIDDNVWIAPHVSTKEWVQIGSNSFIGIGSVIIRNVKPGSKMFGNPAKELLTVRK